MKKLLLTLSLILGFCSLNPLNAEMNKETKKFCKYTCNAKDCKQIDRPKGFNLYEKCRDICKEDPLSIQNCMKSYLDARDAALEKASKGSSIMQNIDHIRNTTKS